MASKEAATSMVARLYVATAMAPLTFGDEKGVQDAVALLAANDDIVHASAWAVSEDGRELGERLGELRRGVSVDPPARIPPTMKLHRTEGELIVDAPVTDATGKVVGVVQAAFSLANEHEALARMERRVLAVSMGASLLLTAILLWVAQRLIVRPLAGLVGAANALGRGESTEVEIHANDEVGALTAAFMSMSSAIQQRERRIAERNSDMRRVLDNVEDGFLAVSPDGTMSAERSRIIEEWFGPPEVGATLFDYFDQMAGEETGEWLRVTWEMLTDGFLPIEVAIDPLPKKFDSNGHFYSVTYRPILDGERLKAMLVVIRDVTKRVELDRADQMQREMLVIFKHVLTDPAAFHAYFADAAGLVASIGRGEAVDRDTLRRQIHTLKGNSAIVGLASVSRYCHELESRMSEDDACPTLAQRAALRTVWDGIASTYEKFRGRGETQIVIDEEEQMHLLRAVQGGAEAREIAAIVTSWRYERAAARMTSIGEQVRQVAERLGKAAVEVHVASTTLRLPPRRWAPFWSVFGHIVRNAADHGLESPARRHELGKSEKNVVRMSFEHDENEVIFRFGDDGAGIDWARVAVKARERGLPADTLADLERALYADAFSTRDDVDETSGRGVGLAAVLECVTAHGGTIEVDSAAGQVRPGRSPSPRRCSSETRRPRPPFAPRGRLTGGPYQDRSSPLDIGRSWRQ